MPLYGKKFGLSFQGYRSPAVTWRPRVIPPPNTGSSSLSGSVPNSPILAPPYSFLAQPDTRIPASFKRHKRRPEASGIVHSPDNPGPTPATIFDDHGEWVPSKNPWKHQRGISNVGERAKPATRRPNKRRRKRKRPELAMGPGEKERRLRQAIEDLIQSGRYKNRRRRKNKRTK